MKLVGVREEDGERRPPAQMVPISKCITTQTKYIRSEISHTSIRKYLRQYKKYTHTNTDQVHSVRNISHKYKKILTQIQEIPTHKYRPGTFTQIQTEYTWSDISQIQVNSEPDIALKYKPQIVGH